MSSKGIAIVLPARFKGHVPESHCTVMFLGYTDEADYTRDMVLTAMDQFVEWFPQEFATAGTDWFGVDRDVPVMRLMSSWLMSYRSYVERILAEEGIYPTKGAVKWPYQPHVSLPDDFEEELPKTVTLYSPVLWWGTER